MKLPMRCGDVHDRCLMFSESQVLYDVRKILCQSDYTPSDPMELCNRLLVTCYMASENSSQETKQRASQVSELI